MATSSSRRARRTVASCAGRCSPCSASCGCGCWRPARVRLDDSVDMIYLSVICDELRSLEAPAVPRSAGFCGCCRTQELRRRRMNVRGLICGLALTGVVAAAAGCSSSSSSGSGSGSSSPGSTTSASGAAASSREVCASPKKVGFVDIFASSPIEHQMDQMAATIVSDLGWQMHFVDAQANYATMQQAVTSFVNEHDELIIVASSDAAPIRQSLQAAKAAGVPVVEVGGGNLDPEHLFTARYNENETLLGQLLGAYIVKTVPNAKIGDLASTINYSGAAREAGLRAAVAASGGKAAIAADQQVDGGNIVPSTTQVLTDMLTAHPDINAVFAALDPSAVPAASAIHSKGSSAKLFTNFATPSNLNLIQKGQLAAVVDDNLPLTVAVSFDQFLSHVKTGAAFNPNAVAEAGGLGYRIVTSPNTVYSNDTTLAPFLAKWKTEFPC